MSSDGKLLVSAGHDGIINLWDLTEFSLLDTINISGLIYEVVLTPDNRFLASAGSNNKINLWKFPQLEHMGEFIGHTDAPVCLEVVEDGKILISGGLDNSVRYWSIPDGRLIQTISEHEGSVDCLALQDKEYLITAYDEDIKLWPYGIHPDRDNYEFIFYDMPWEGVTTLKGHDSLVYSLRITPDGWNLVSGGADNTVIVWDLEKRKLLKTLEGHGGWVYDLAFISDGKTLITAAGDGYIIYWSLPGGKPIKSFKAHDRSVKTILITHDGENLVSAGEDRLIKIWELDS